MSGNSPSRPKPIQWWLEDMAHRLVEGLASRLSGPQAFRLGEILGEMAWYLLPKRRRIVMRNLRIAMGGNSRRHIVEQKARECFRRTGANLVSVAWTARVSPDRLSEVLEIENPELLEERLAAGKGVVLLLSHMGNWELLSRIAHFFPKGTKAGAFYRPLNNPVLDRRVLERRQADGVRMFSKHDNLLQVAGLVREGAVVGILADQRVGRQGELVRFFGRATRASPLPSLLARRTRCPVLALALVCEGPSIWKARFLDVEKPHTTERCMNSLERAMRQSLTDVFWFQERWRTYLSRRKKICDWLEDRRSADGMRHRAAVWSKDPEEAKRLLNEGWLHPDVDYDLVYESGRRSIRRKLRDLEWDAPLPIDYVVTRTACPELQAACRAEAIHLVVTG